MDILPFGEEAQKRYNTVMTNIAVLTASFYDSYLDLLEESIKTILRENKIKFDRKNTCGHLIKTPKIKEFFENNMLCSSFGCSTDDLQQTIKMCNDHKHNASRELDFATISNFMETFFDLANCYSIYKRGPGIIYDVEYFYNLYGSSARMDEAKKVTIERQKETIEKQNKIIGELKEQVRTQVDQFNKNKNQRDNANTQGKSQVISFLEQSKKFDFWWGPVKRWLSAKRIYIGLLIATLAIGFISTITTTVSFGLYSTFTLFENIWLIVVLVIMCRALKTKKVLTNDEFVRLTTFKFMTDHVGYQRCTRQSKFRYKLFTAFGIIAPILNIVALAIDDNPVKGLSIVLEIVLVVLTIAQIFASAHFYSMYQCAVLFRGINQSSGVETTLVGHTIDGSLQTYEDFVKNYGGIDFEILS